MRNNEHLNNDIGRIFGCGATLMLMGYLLHSIIIADFVAENALRQIMSPGTKSLAVSMVYLIVLLLFIAYASHLMDKRNNLGRVLAKYQAGMDASIDGIFIFNENRECAYLNQAQAILHGYTSHQQALGKSWRHFYNTDEIERFEREVFPTLLAKGEWRGEAVGLRKDGSTYPQEISLTSVDRDNIVCIVRDMSAQKKIERELQVKAGELAEANRELEAFGYSLTHDMRSYLTRMYSAAQILRDNYQESLDENGRFLVNVVCVANEEMARLITDMMVLSRIVRSEINREKVNLSKLANEIITELIHEEPDRRVKFTITPGLVADCDRQLVMIALKNLLRNAWKYSENSPESLIKFGVTNRNGRLVFFVRDNGMGFDMKDVDKLFKPFQRLPNAKGLPGSGIGLTTVQRVIQRHEGEIWAEGEREKGATFFFTLENGE